MAASVCVAPRGWVLGPCPRSQPRSSPAVVAGYPSTYPAGARLQAMAQARKVLASQEKQRVTAWKQGKRVAMQDAVKQLEASRAFLREEREELTSKFRAAQEAKAAEEAALAEAAMAAAAAGASEFKPSPPLAGRGDTDVDTAHFWTQLATIESRESKTYVQRGIGMARSSPFRHLMRMCTASSLLGREAQLDDLKQRLYFPDVNGYKFRVGANGVRAAMAAGLATPCLPACGNNHHG